jgi:hypothetical protein
MLSTLALRGATNMAEDVAVKMVHGWDVASKDADVQEVLRVAGDIMENIRKLDLDKLTTGNLNLDTVVQAGAALVPVWSAIGWLALDGVWTWNAVKAAYYEFQRGVGGSPDPGKTARANDLLVGALLFSAILQLRN